MAVLAGPGPVELEGGRREIKLRSGRRAGRMNLTGVIQAWWEGAGERPPPWGGGGRVGLKADRWE